MISSREKGDIGEGAALNYLVKSGYTILEKNFRTRYGEIDIIGKNGPYITFIEVKSRRDLSMGYPYEAVNIYKQRKIARMALVYIAKNNLYNENFRFDIVEIIVKDNEIKYLNLIKDAFQVDVGF